MIQQQQFDAIVIGSGIGGLTVAAILAKFQHKKVLVLEQHFTVGGFTHSFSRGKFDWDVGLHYVGDMGEGDTGKAVFDYLTDGKLHWQKMPEPFEKFVYPDFTFAVSGVADKYQADLIELFPQHSQAIQQYFADLKRAVFWFGAYNMMELFPAWLQPLLKVILKYGGGIARQTTQSYLENHFTDERLKALLVSQWGTYGLPPAESCFGIHSTIVTHYLKGGWYPVGGAKAIAQGIIPVIERAGGAVITQRKVTELLIESGVAVGVKAQKTSHPDGDIEQYYGSVVVSDAGAFNTYLKLIPESYPLPYRQDIKAFPKGTTALSLYLGLKDSPEKLGFRGENHWIYETYNHNEIIQKNCSEQLPQSCYLSFPSLKDPTAESHTAEIIAFTQYDFFQQWSQQRWRKRDADYRELKTKITQDLLNLVEFHYPGFQDLVEYAELSTPLTVEHFDASDRGTIYGIPCIPQRLGKPWVRSRTPIKNLYLTGADTLLLGIMGAMMGGVKTAGLLKGGFGFFQIMGIIMKEAGKVKS
ncbi:MAG: NAD(P)/FAD-dependent oxidoreductase [Nostocaceae cyanobacterium]|nr:NAD(P)/FAD-dependent oxidoreductase [Nostocaceae cyanobacterium]